MYGVINDVDFGELENMKYYAPPSSWSNEKKQENARAKIFSGDWYGALKNDGFFAKLIKDEDGTVILYGRSRGVSGKYADKHEWVPHLQPLFEALPVGTCLLGELYLPNKPGSRYITSVMGCLKDKALARQKKDEDRLHFYAFDMLAYNGKSMLGEEALYRFEAVENLKEIIKAPYFETAHYYRGEALWAKLQKILAEGGEGMVITKFDAKYEPGKRPSKTTLKIKQELKQTIDCFFTGRFIPPARDYTGKEIETWQYWMNSITGEKMTGTYFKDYARGAALVPVTKSYYNDWAGSLEIGVFQQCDGEKCVICGIEYLNKKILPLGYLSGLPEEIKANVMAYAFKPIEVTAMSYDAVNNTLRHGKMIGWREDLPITDCTYEKIAGMV